MAISVIASAKNSVRANASTTGITVTHGMTLVNGDVLYAFLGQGDDPGTVWASSSGGTWTSIVFLALATGNDRCHGVLRRVVTNAAGEPSTYTFTLDNNATDNLVAIVVQVRGLDTTTPEDATPTTNQGPNDFTPTQVAIDTATNNAGLLISHLASGLVASTDFSAATAGAPATPSGMSIVNSEFHDDETNDFSIFLEVAKLEDAGAAGTKTFGAWTGSPDDTASEWSLATVALRPLVAGQELTRSDTDKLFMLDARSGVMDKQTASERLFIGDATHSVPERPRNVSDGLFMRDDRTSETSLQLRSSLLLLTLMAKTRESTLLDKLLILSRPLVHDHDLKYLPELLFLRDTVSTEIPTPAIERSILDGLFMRDERTSDRGSVLRDTVFLLSLRSSDRLSMQRDGLLILDSALPSVERTRLALDNLFAADADYRLREATQRDGVLVSVARYSEVLRTLLDLLLLVDSVSAVKGAVELERLVTDGLLLLDARFFVQEHIARDSLLFYDQRVSELAKTVTDKLLVADTVDRLRLPERLAIDGLLLADSVLRGIENVHRDGLFVTDTVDAQKTGAIIRYALDGLLLMDAVLRDEAHSHRDWLLLGDSTFREILRTLRSSLLVIDSPSAALERTRYAIDAVALFDRATRDRLLVLLDRLLVVDDAIAQLEGGAAVFNRTAVDNLFLEDRRLSSELAKLVRDAVLASSVGSKAKEMIKFITDAVLMGDRRFSSELARALRDGLGLFDRMTKIQQQQHRDSALITSAAMTGRGIARELSDAMLMLDRQSSTREVTRLDAVLIHLLAARARELLDREGLLLNDVVSAQWFPIVIEFITYVRLAVVSVLGVTTNAVDPVGIRLASVDPLGLKLNWSRWRIDGA